MIETATNARSVFPLPVTSCSSSAAPLPVPEDDFRWNVYHPHPPPPPPSSDCSSQRSAPGGETQYTRHLRRALQKSRSRDHIDDVLRHSDGHPGGFWAEFGYPPKCDYPPPQGQPLFYQQAHHYGGLGTTNTWAPSGCGGGRAGARTGCDVSEATMTTSGCSRGDAEEEEEEEANFVSPPKIMPLGGRIITANDHSILKPVPFKPVNVPVSVPVPCSSSSSSSFDRSNFRKVFSHDSSLDRVAKTTASSSHVTVAPDDGYASREWQNHSWPSSSSPASSSHRRRGVSFTQTPSPSDSGVGEVEALLRERERELKGLRERMERNETAMMEAFEERRRRWERETGDVIDQWRVKVEGQQQRSFRAEQGLLLQIFRLQQENRKLTEEKNENAVKNRKEEEEEEREQEELVLERDRLKAETEVLRTQLKEAVEEVARKSTELTSAQLVLRDNEIEKDCKNSEIRTLLANVDRLQRDLLGQSGSSSSPSSSTSPSSSIEGTRRELEQLKTTLEVERNQWSAEKTKVINYQKHLQLNYVRMARRNRLLEAQVQQLMMMMMMTSEIDGRRHGNECRRVVKEESLC